MYNRIDSTEVWHHRTSSESSAATEEATVHKSVDLPLKAVSNWSLLEKLPNIINTISLSDHNLPKVNSSLAIPELRQSQYPDAGVTPAGNNKNKQFQFDSDCVESENSRPRCYSSTRGDFLDPADRRDFQDLEGNFLSESPAVFTDMESENESGEGQSSVCPDCKGESCDKCAIPAGDELTKAMWAALKKIDTLTDKVIGLEQHLVLQNGRLSRLEGACHDGSSQESGNRDSYHKTRPHKGNIGKTSTKKDRVEEEKDRTFKVLQEKLRTRNRGKKDKSDTDTGSDSSGEEVDLKALRKKMSGKQREECNKKLSAKLKQVGATFPEDDYDSTSSSGTDSSYGSRSCRN